MDIMNEIKKEQRVNDLISFVISFLTDLYAENPDDEKLRGLKEDVECAHQNYNEAEEQDVSIGNQEDVR